MKLNQGLHVVGVLDGYVAEPWSSNGKSGTNHILGVSRQYTNKFSQMKEETYQISLPNDVVALKQISEIAKKAEGKLVAVPVAVNAKEGKQNKGPWISYFMPKGSQITVLE